MTTVYIYGGCGATTNYVPFVVHYGLCLRKFVHINLPKAGLELEFLVPQAGMLPIKPPMRVTVPFVYLYIQQTN